jgi:hypothetical protein
MLPMKKNKRPTTARFNAEECELLLEAVQNELNHAISDPEWDEDDPVVQTWYRIRDRLRDRIEKEKLSRSTQTQQQLD